MINAGHAAYSAHQVESKHLAGGSTQNRCDDWVAFAERHPQVKRVVAVEFLCRVLDKWLHRGRALPTDNGGRFTPQTPQLLPDGHRFDRICREYGVAHCPTKPAHLWTHGQVERRNRTVKEAPVQCCYDQTTDELREHFHTFLRACNHAKRLQKLRGLTPPQIRLCPMAKEPRYLYP